MPKGYWIAHIDVTDAEAYKGYVPLSTATLQAFGGKPLVRGGANEIKEGQAGPRHVVVEFPSYEQALAAYNSGQYQEALKIRTANAISQFIIVEGHDG